MVSASAAKRQNMFLTQGSRTAVVLTRREVYHGRASVDNERIFSGVVHLAPSDAIWNDGVEGVFPGCLLYASNICLS
jgi:hypothetical protein